MDDRIHELHDEIEKLRAELAAIEKAERAKLREECQPIWEFTIEPAPSGTRWDRLYDDTCEFVRISGRCVNKEEARAAGHSMSFGDGGMQYVFNKATKKIVCSTGGGNVYIQGSEAMARISEFYAEHPDGGDITEIVVAARDNR